MNTLRKIAMTAMALVLSTAITFAAPSKQNNGSSYSLTTAQTDVYVDKFEEAKVTLDPADKWTNVPADVLAKINDFNDGKISLAELVDGVDVSGYAALSSCDDVVMYNTNAEILSGTNVDITVKNAAINSTVANSTIKIAHYSTVDQKWELVDTKNVDTSANSLEATMPTLSPVVLIYTTTTANTNTVPNTGLYANPAYLGIGAACVLVAVVLIAKKKKA